MAFKTVASSDSSRRSPAVPGRQHPSEQTRITPSEPGRPPWTLRWQARSAHLEPPVLRHRGHRYRLFLGRLEVPATVRTWVSARPLRFLDLADVDIPSLVDLAGRTSRPWLLSDCRPPAARPTRRWACRPTRHGRSGSGGPSATPCSGTARDLRALRRRDDRSQTRSTTMASNCGATSEASSPQLGPPPFSQRGSNRGATDQAGPRPGASPH